jgi:acetoacetyl-CoA synthetase
MGKILWEPSEERVKLTNTYRFIQAVNKRFGKNFADYPSLYEWSVENISDFWASVWDFVEIKAESSYEEVVVEQDKMPGARWFPGTRLNFAENLLRFRDDQVAIIFVGEGQEPVRTTYRELYDKVSRLTKSLRTLGIKPKDRVVGFMPNMTETMIAMMAATSLGATWSSCSPDFGIKGVMDRFGQIEPKVIFTADGYYYNGKQFDSLERISNVVKQLPSLEKIVVVSYTREKPDISFLPNAEHFDDFLAPEAGEIEFEQLPFDHPVYIMYSSGTTGLPKCMVQGPGVLLNHKKELILHTDLKREDTIFYFTTCGWMMWNWLTSALSVGATLLLYDGSPFYPKPGILWEIAEREGISIFGTSAKYLAALEKEGVKPGKKYKLDRLKAVLSTGSPLSIESFEYAYRDIKEDLQLSSISGGTDLNGCFALGNPIGPVYAGELQCRGLGMAVQVFDEMGHPIYDKKGELVCTKPFPSMPLYFWNDPDGEKYHNAYFTVYPNIWHHGDYAEIKSDTGGMIIYGRSDATLNPGGVRIGTAEIYRQVEAIDEILDSLVVGQNWDNDVRVILFVKLREGVELTEELKKKIKKTIRENATPRHVPAKIIAVADIPYTISGKKVELAVKKVIHGEPVVNRDALANPESLDLYKNLKELQE